MTTPRDPDGILATWLDEGPTRLPEQTRRAILVGLPSVTQKRRFLDAPWRFPTMSTSFRLSIGVAAVIAVILGGAYFLGPRAPGVGGGPSSSPSPTVSPTPSPSPTVRPTPSPSPSASPSAALPPIDTSTWTAYTSSQYGFNVGHPADWDVVPATRTWTFELTAGTF